jgi:predicted  nucleic acid-binding Zn-ribbon protein
LGYELSVIEGAIYKNQNELDVFKKKMEKEGKLTITTDPEKQQEIERLKQSLVAVQKDKELLNINLNERESLVGGLNKRVGELEQEILKIKSDSEKQKQELEEKYKKYKEICEAFGYIDKEAKPDFSILEVD